MSIFLTNDEPASEHLEAPRPVRSIGEVLAQLLPEYELDCSPAALPEESWSETVAADQMHVHAVAGGLF